MNECAKTTIMIKQFFLVDFRYQHNVIPMPTTTTTTTHRYYHYDCHFYWLSISGTVNTQQYENAIINR